MFLLIPPIALYFGESHFTAIRISVLEIGESLVLVLHGYMDRLRQKYLVFLHEGNRLRCSTNSLLKKPGRSDSTGPIIKILPSTKHLPVWHSLIPWWDSHHRPPPTASMILYLLNL